MGDYILKHHGIKGQKWGVRRFQNKNGTYTPAGRKRRLANQDNWSEDARTVSQLRKKSVNEMSNVELKKYNERVRLEQEYSRLNPSAVSKGWKYVAGAAVATNTVLNLYNNSDKLIKIGKPFVDKMLKKKVE
jgi:hypothetical protein